MNEEVINEGEEEEDESLELHMTHSMSFGTFKRTDKSALLRSLSSTSLQALSWSKKVGGSSTTIEEYNSKEKKSSTDWDWDEVVKKSDE